MKLHLVGGFLGSGKTTAIIAAAKTLMARGMRVGVITNDQGRYLVDTAFFRLSDIPAVEVTGGCFCCNYDDLNSRMKELIELSNPQVIFAKSVGSCADLVATVVKPLLTLGEVGLSPTSFSVFADSRLLLRRWSGAEMPFSDDVVYIFDKQIEEAGLLVVNKTDLLPLEAYQKIETEVDKRLPGKPYLMQSSLSMEGVWTWVNRIQSGQAALPVKSLQMDYSRYAQGEASLAWLDQEIWLNFAAGQGKAMIEKVIRALADQLAERKAGIGHLKWILSDDGVETKISFPSIEEPGWQAQIPEVRGSEARLLMNARVEMGAEELRATLEQALNIVGVGFTFGKGETFHPQEPHPTHRL